jgi:hypothetical protein
MKTKNAQLITQATWDRAFAELATAPLPTPRALAAAAKPREVAMYSRGRRAAPTTSPDPIDEWGTPPWLFERLAQEFRITLDVCGTRHNTVVPRNFISPDEDGLSVSWAARSRGGVAWCNPPYGSVVLKHWMRKARLEATRITVVCLVPAKPAQQFWWQHVIRGEIRFMKGHLKYLRDGVEGGWAPFPSAVVVFGPKVRACTKWWGPNAIADRHAA